MFFRNEIVQSTDESPAVLEAVFTCMRIRSVSVQASVAAACARHLASAVDCMWSYAGYLRQFAILRFRSARSFGGHTEERRLRTNLDAVSVLLGPMPACLRKASSAAGQSIERARSTVLRLRYGREVVNHRSRKTRFGCHLMLVAVDLKYSPKCGSSRETNQKRT
jgi:hypothetical protein